MTRLLIVGGGLFGSLAAAYARSRGLDALVFDSALPGAASPCAAGLFREPWAGRKYHEHFHAAIPVLDSLYGLRRVTLENLQGGLETFHFVPPSAILEASPIRRRVTAWGDGWLETGDQRHEGYVYIAAGVWCPELVPDTHVIGKAGAAFLFPGETPGKFHPYQHGRQALAFVRDPGLTYFSDGTAELHYTAEHDQATLGRAYTLGLSEPPLQRLWGRRPYTPGGLTFRQLASRTWLATGGRKLGTLLAASSALRLIDTELRLAL